MSRVYGGVVGVPVIVPSSLFVVGVVMLCSSLSVAWEVCVNLLVCWCVFSGGCLVIRVVCISGFCVMVGVAVYLPVLY